jgi:hypothetical protein
MKFNYQIASDMMAQSAGFEPAIRGLAVYTHFPGVPLKPLGQPLLPRIMLFAFYQHIKQNVIPKLIDLQSLKLQSLFVLPS